MENTLKMTPWNIFWKQVRVLTLSNLKSRYRKTFAGFLWVIINPLVMYAVQSQIFSKFLKLGVPNYYRFLLAGLLPWIFIVQSIDICTPLFQSLGPLLKAFPANPLVYLASQLVDNFINFLAAFFIILAFTPGTPETNVMGYLFLPISILFIVAFTFGTVLFLATWQVFFRDTKFIMSFVMSVMYFLTPVFYPAALVPAHLKWIVDFNPFYIMIAPLRSCLYSFDVSAFPRQMGIAAALSLVVLFSGLELWSRKRNEIYFYL